MNPYVNAISYVPAIHKGYVKFFREHQGHHYVLGPDVLERFPLLARDLRALEPIHAAQSLRGLNLGSPVEVLGQKQLSSMSLRLAPMVMPDDEVHRTLATESFPGMSVEFVPIFLRWGFFRAFNKPLVTPNRKISYETFDCEIMREATRLATRSSDWWRQVGACMVRNGEVCYWGYNHHLPTAYAPDIDGDPRANFNAGEFIELSTAHHAEKQIIAMCARDQVSTRGASLYVTTFPCRGCAMDIAVARFARVYYVEGYSQIDADEILRGAGIELIQVILDELIT